MRQVSSTQAPQLLANASWFRELILSEELTRQTIDGFNVHQFHWKHALSYINYIKCPSLRLGISEIRDDGVICRRVETLDELKFRFWFSGLWEWTIASETRCRLIRIRRYLVRVLTRFSWLSARHGAHLDEKFKTNSQIWRRYGSFGRRDIGVCSPNSFVSKTNDCDQCPTVQLWMRSQTTSRNENKTVFAWKCDAKSRRIVMRQMPFL